MKKENRDVHQIGIIISIIVVALLIVYFSSLKENIFFEPATGTVGAFIQDLMDNPQNYQIVLSDSSQELFLKASSFSQEFDNIQIINLNETDLIRNNIFIGLFSDFYEFPYKDKIMNKDAITIFNVTSNNLYVYAKDFLSLEEMLSVLRNINSEVLNYPQVELVKGYIEELFLEPIVVSKRVVEPLFSNKETKVILSIEVLRTIDSLLLAERLSNGFKIIDKSPGFILNSSNLIVWYGSSLNPGNYTFNYTFIPFSFGEIIGKVGVKIGDSEEDYSIYGQSSFSVNSLENKNQDSSGGSSGGLQGFSEDKFISFLELSNGKFVNLGSVILEMNLGENYTFVLKEINKDYVVFLLNGEVINVVLGQSTKISLFNNQVYDFLINLKEIGNNQAQVFLMRINQTVSFDEFDIEQPTSINLDSLNSANAIFIKSFIFSAIVLIIIVFSLVFFNKKDNGLIQKNINNPFLEKAKKLVLQYKYNGYSNEEIRKMFKEKGWTEVQINRILS